MKKKFLLFFSFVFFCSSMTLAEQSPITIGAMAELSGPFASIGEDCRRGYEIAEAAFLPNRKIGNRPVTFLLTDHQRDPKKGVSEFSRFLLTEKALALVVNASPVAMAINPISKSKGVVLLGSIGHPDFTGMNPYAFRFWINAEREGQALAQKAIALGKRQVAIVSLEDDYALSLAKGFEKNIQSSGGKIVFSDTFLHSDSDFSSLITKIKSSSPEAIFISVLGDSVGVLIKKMREQNLPKQIFGTFSLGKQENIATAGTQAIEGSIYAEIDGNRPKFLKYLHEKYGISKATGLHYACYSAAAAAFEVIRQNPSLTDSTEFFRTMSAITQIPLLDGPLPIESREAQFDMVYRIIREGKVADL